VEPIGTGPPPARDAVIGIRARRRHPGGPNTGGSGGGSRWPAQGTTRNRTKTTGATMYIGAGALVIILIIVLLIILL
jgi:hypothetical protein